MTVSLAPELAGLGSGATEAGPFTLEPAVGPSRQGGALARCPWGV
jgi:hypothetical protein